MQRVEVQLEDDLTGGPADETVVFGVAGTAYEIDLSSRHAAEFRRRLAPYVERARLLHPQRRRTTFRTAASRERSRQIRAWAERQGLPVSGHGRLPSDVVRQYETAHAGEQTAERPTGRSAAKRAGASRRSTKPKDSAGRSSRQRAAHRTS
jgi:hypothetical protein